MQIRSIKYWAIIVIILLSIIMMALYGYLSFRNLKQSFISQYENKAEAILNEHNNTLEHHFSHVETILSQFSESFIHISKYDNRRVYIEKNLAEYQNMLTGDGCITYFISENEQYFSSEDAPQYLFGNKPFWYEEPMNNPHNIIWFDPYNDEETGNLVITAAKKVQERSGKEGVVAVDYYLDSLNLTASGIGKEGLIFLISKDGLVLTNNKKMMVGKILFGDKFKEAIAKSNKEHVPFQLNDTTYYFLSKEIEQNGMYIVTAFSEHEINKNLIESHYDIFLIGIFTVILFSIIVYLLTLWSVRPLRDLGKVMNAVENGNYDVKAKAYHYEEVSRLANGFNKMLQAIKKRDRELHISNKELQIIQNKLKTENEKLVESQKILKASEAKVNFLASHDSLTGLLNRRSLMERLTESLEHNTSDKFKVVLFIDLDNFKVVNDTLGHSCGDLLLIEVANKLLSIPFEEKDVARISGDEFILVLHEIESMEEIEKIADNISKYFQSPISIGTKVLNVTASVGIAIYPIHATNAEDLLKIADMAMYKAKDCGKKGYKIFDEGIQKEVEQQLEMEQGIRESLKNDGFELYFQPLYNTKLNKVTSVETLLRTKNEKLSKYNIIDIIHTAEVTSQIIELDRWIFKNACIAIQKINSLIHEDITVSVNISAVHIMQPNFTESIISIIEESGVDPKLVELEITETSLMKSFDINNAKLEKLKGIGLSIHLDDFGTGYSSLSYLNKLPIDHLKIDKSFITPMLKNEKDSRVVETIITLAHNIGLQVVAEGVEDEEQFNVLKEYQCELIQGYFISRPMSFDNLIDYLQKQNKIEIN